MVTIYLLYKSNDVIKTCGIKDVKHITKTKIIDPSEISLSEGTIELQKGETYDIKRILTVKYTKENTVTYTSSNPDKIISFWTKEISRQKIISKKAVNEYIQVAIKEKIEETKKEFQKNATTFINLIQEQLRDCKNKKETSEDNSEIIKNTISKIEEIENKVKLENSI